jgi:PAS domain S-box-containing protein
MKPSKPVKRTGKISPAIKDSENNRFVKEKYSQSFLLAPDAITVSELDTGRFIEVNDAASYIFGYSREELIGKSASELGIWLNKEDRDAFIVQVTMQGRLAQYETVERCKSGELKNVSITADIMIIGTTRYLIAVIRDITDRKQTEKALKESESRYSALFTNNYSVSLLIDPDTGRITDANEAAVRYYGYSHDQLTAMGIYDLNRLPEDKVIRNLRRAKDEKEKHFFSTHYRADGEKRYVEIYSGPITVQGKPLFYSIIHDITERKTAEEALRHSEATLKVILQSSPIPKFVIDSNHRVIFWNTSLEETSGIRAEEVIGTNQHWRAFYPTARPCIADLLVDGDAEKISLHYAGKFKKSVTEGTYDVTDFFPHLGENGKWLRAIAAPIIDSGGRVIGAVETLEDITGLINAQQSLKESEERYRTLIDQLPDYVIVHRDGILLYVNPAAAARFGYNAELLVGKPILQFIAPEYHGAVRDAVIRRMAGEDPPGYEMKIRTKDGTFRTVLTNGSMVNYQGRPASLNVLSDITDRKLMEEEIRSLNRVLEQRVTDRTEALSKSNEQLTAEIAARNKAEQQISRSLEEKDLLLREIHHRVKNNLQIIASLLNLQSRAITDPNVLEAIKGSQSRIRAMALVHERIYRSHNIAEINLRDYLNYLTKQIFQFYNIQQHLIGITVTMDEILADIDTVTPLGLIINELVSNSLKYAFPEGRKGSISTECTRLDPDMLRIIYHDDGIGMPAGFDWKHTESLGLRLVNSLVDQLNGTIEMGDGEGTTFVITIQHKRDPQPS